MSAQNTVPVPKDGESMIVWAANNGRAAIDLLNALALLEVSLIPYSGSTRGKASLTISAQNSVLSLPLQYNKAIADPLANISDTNAAVKSVLLMLRTIGLLPNN